MEGVALHGLGPYGPMDPMSHMMHSDMDDFPHHMDELKNHHVDDYALSISLDTYLDWLDTYVEWMDFVVSALSLFNSLWSDLLKKN